MPIPTVNDLNLMSRTIVQKKQPLCFFKHRGETYQFISSIIDNRHIHLGIMDISHHNLQDHIESGLIYLET